MQTNWKRTNLNGDWTLFYQPNSQYVQSGAHPTTMDDLCAQEGCIPAVVPGNFEIDLQRAGRLEDPFFGQNVLKVQKLEAMHMFYGRRFEYHPTAGTAPVLTFEGLDTVAEIFLNGRRVGRCENMLIAQTFELDDLTIESFDVRFRVRNTGSRPGKAVPQVYVGYPAEAGEPPAQLKGFAAVRLEPGDVIIIPESVF